MTKVRPSQIWERRESPGAVPVIVREVGAGKVTYQAMTPGRRTDVVTVQAQTFKRHYKRKRVQS